MAFIEFHNVCKKYKLGELDLDALSDVSFEIERGEICTIVGPSGAGKTTVLNILGGMDTCTSGDVIVDDRAITKLGKRSMTLYRRKDVGFVFQFYNLIQNLTAYENIELVAKISRNPLDSFKMLELVGLEDRAPHSFREASSREYPLPEHLLKDRRCFCAMSRRVRLIMKQVSRF